MVGAVCRLVRRPGDVPLMIAIGWFVATIPKRIERAGDFEQLLNHLREARWPRASQERVARLRGWWLWKRYGDRNTCYVRALTMYRFLDAPSEGLRLHLGIEERDASHDRLHGHAWVSVGGRIVEGPEPALAGRVREIPLAKAVM